MNKIIAVFFIITPLIILEASGINKTKEIDSSIYLQRDAWNLSFHIVQYGKKTPIGRHYGNLLPILENSPEAFKVATEGIALLKKANRHSWIIISLILINQPVLEQMMEKNNDKYLIPVNIVLWGGLIHSVYYTSSSSRKGLNKIRKAIWLYNKSTQ